MEEYTETNKKYEARMDKISDKLEAKLAYFTNQVDRKIQKERKK